MTVSDAFDRRAHPAEARFSRWSAPDGWVHRRFDWTATDARGRLLFQAGRADMIEKYLEAFAFFRAQGWSVTSFDWRGQGGSGRLGHDRRAGRSDELARHVDDLAAFWAEWREEAAGATAIVGHSMAGFVTLRTLADARIAPAAAVLVAPMLGLRTPFGRWGEAIARIVGGLGDRARPAWRESGSARADRDRRRRLTHDAVRYADELWWYAHDPALRLGPPSWAWIDAAFHETRLLAADPRLGAVATPILMLVTDHDRLVDAATARRVADRLPHAELIGFGPDAAHELLRERDSVRLRALAAIGAFLDREVGRT